ncbi:HAD-IA family hydrolase [Kolteria novifilia]|uniref:HAD-IA family hydrolase n=1 Tax=Kolteria novifilia TaxID=2527975 RepID=UPI003AF3BB3B
MSAPDVDAVLFDAGMTLLEPVLPVAEIYLQEARELGTEVPQDEFVERLRGLWPKLASEYRSAHPELECSEEMELQGWWRFTHELSRPFATLHEQHDEWLARLFQRFDDPQTWKTTPGALACLEACREEGREAAIVSNWHSSLHGILRGHGLDQFVTFTLTSAEIGRKKPHREIFQAALDQLGVNASSVVHIGDSWEEDVLGAAALGIRPVHLAKQRAASTDCPSAAWVRSLEDFRVAKLKTMNR